MSSPFADTLKRLRQARGLSQIQLGRRVFVSNSTIARWENGSRLPDATMIARLSKALEVDIGTLLSTVAASDESPNVIMMDDNKPILADSLSVLEEAIPNAIITGFIWPQEAIEYARANRVALAIVDIELGTTSGLDLCHTLLEVNPHTNVVFLTAYPDYSLDAWGTEACGFMVKPLTLEGIRKQLGRLRYPLMRGAGT